jgi:hypothetical protein
VLDANGKIAATNASELAGTVLSDEWAARTPALRDPQGGAVSAFAPTPLYADRPTRSMARRSARRSRRSHSAASRSFDPSAPRRC